MQKSTVYCLLFLLVPVGIFFLPILVADQTFGYRDSGRFYYRQFEWNKSQWESGRIPLWNPQENLGTAVVGEASSSVFYPLQVVFLIPWMKFSTAFVLYAAVHVYLASVGTLFLARSLRCGILPSLIAAIAFSLCGSVLFQTCNIVFLVGASWLPLGILFTYQIVNPETKSKPVWKILVFRSLILGSTLAMTTLGGDPQTAYHIGIVAAILVTFRLYSGWRDAKFLKEFKSLSRSVAILVLGATFGFGLAAVQILPSLKASRESTRDYFTHPRTIYEAWQEESSSMTNVLFGHPVPGTHHDHIYQFSQPPWSAIELIWPNVTGKIQPRHGRWSDFIPATGRNWTASIYCGLIPFLFFMSGMLRKSKVPEMRWLKGTFLIFGIGSLGWFGFGWLMHEIANQFQQTEAAVFRIGAPVGGVYWFFVKFLPGYVSFRYPAKLAVVASLFLSLIAAKEMQFRSRKYQLNSFRRYLLGTVILTSFTFLGLWFCSVSINQMFARFRLDPAFFGQSEFGPFDPKAAWEAILFGLIHAAVIAMIAIAVLNQTISRNAILRAFLLITVMDLFFANRNLLLTVDADAWKPNQAVAAAIEKRVAGSGHSNDPIRIFRTGPMTWSASQGWLGNSDASRLQQIVEWENLTMMPKHPLGGRFQMVESFRSIEPLDFALFINFCKRLPGIGTGPTSKTKNQTQLSPNPIMLGMLGCRFIMIPKWGKPNIPKDAVLEEFVTGELRELDFLIFENPYFQPRFRIATNFFPDVGLKALNNAGTPSAVKLRNHATEFFGNPNSATIDDRPRKKTMQQPVINSDANKPLLEFEIKVIHDEPTFIELEVDTASTSDKTLLVIADYFDDDWIAYRMNEYDRHVPVKIDRANLILRGIELNSQRTRVQMFYRPTRVICGGVISLSFVLLGSVIAIVCWRKRTL